MDVDRYGCINLESLKSKVILNVRYRKGSFEVDHKTLAILDSLVILLNKAHGVRVEINAYTDNAGKFSYNKTLAQKRANRIRDYIVSRGIDSNRLMPIGRGEVNFVASNNTETGRQKNRRIELLFYR